MARATRNGPVDRASLPDGMKVFVVTGATIRDSLGAYCTMGQEAVLNKKDAERYHKTRQIAADLPSFEKSPTPEEAQAALDALEQLQAQLAKEREAFAKQLEEKEAALAAKEEALQTGKKLMAGAAGATKEEAEKGDDGAAKSGAGEGGEAEAATGTNRRQARA